MHDRHRVAGGSQPGRQHHVADLGHGRGGQRLLDVVLGATDDRAEEQRHRADDHHGGLRGGCGVEDRARAHDEVDARGDHGRGVDQGADGGGALHGVTEPGLQRHLGALAARTEQQQQADGGERAAGHGRHRGEHRAERHRADRVEQHHQGDGQTHVADPVDHEGLLGGGGCAGLVGPEPDQQVGRQTDALPTHVEPEVVVGEDEQQHRRHEQVQVGKKATPRRVVGHVADGVDVDQRTHAGDEQHEAHRQRVELQAEVDLQHAHGYPGEQHLVHRA